MLSPKPRLQHLVIRVQRLLQAALAKNSHDRAAAL